MNFNSTAFQQLFQTHISETPFVSIYIPTARAGQSLQDKTRFKNAVNQARDQLVAGHMLLGNPYDKQAAIQLLQPAYDLLQAEAFWMHLSDGLAVFIMEDRIAYYTVPLQFPETVYVGHELYLHHLLPLITGETRFFLLALSQGKVRFFEGSQHSITPVRIHDLVPQSRALMAEEVPAQSLQYHTDGRGQAIYHGHGSGKDRDTEHLKEYLRAIDRGLMEMLHDESAPMIIAAVDYLVPLYREVSEYGHLLETHISGNPDDTEPTLLHEKAWHTLGSHFNKRKMSLLHQYPAYTQAHRTSADLDTLVPAAKSGSIETLFISNRAGIRWGYHKVLTDYSVKQHDRQAPHNTCLLNYTAMSTWQNGGTVYHLNEAQMPRTGTDMCAIMRY